MYRGEEIKSSLIPVTNCNISQFDVRFSHSVRKYLVFPGRNCSSPNIVGKKDTSLTAFNEGDNTVCFPFSFHPCPFLGRTLVGTAVGNSVEEIVFGAGFAENPGLVDCGTGWAAETAQA